MLHRTLGTRCQCDQTSLRLSYMVNVSCLRGSFQAIETFALLLNALRQGVCCKDLEKSGKIRKGVCCKEDNQHAAQVPNYAAAIASKQVTISHWVWYQVLQSVCGLSWSTGPALAYIYSKGRKRGNWMSHQEGMKELAQHPFADGVADQHHRFCHFCSSLLPEQHRQASGPSTHGTEDDHIF